MSSALMTDTLAPVSNNEVLVVVAELVYGSRIYGVSAFFALALRFSVCAES